MLFPPGVDIERAPDVWTPMRVDFAAGSRVNVAVRPIGVDGPLVSIRKFAARPIRMNRLVELGSVTPEMAQIFAAEDRRLGRTVMLKTPRDDEGLPAGMNDMFQRRVTAEARVLAKLQHPSIVTLYELGKSTVGWPFCVLEKVDGVSLRDRLDELVREAAAGLEEVVLVGVEPVLDRVVGADPLDDLGLGLRHYAPPPPTAAGMNASYPSASSLCASSAPPSATILPSTKTWTKSGVM